MEHIKTLYQDTISKLDILKAKRKAIVKEYVKELEDQKLQNIRKSLGI